MFFRCVRADLFKMKRNAVLLAHIVIPVIVSAVFLLYYAVSGQSHEEISKVTGFYQTLGAAYPVLIGIFTASTIEQEQNAGAFQNLLTLKSKTAALFSKAAVLILFGFIALLFTSALFGYGFCALLGQGSTGIGLHIAASLVMWISAIPLYLIFEILAFLFGKGVTIGAGFFAGLLSALFLTNMGMYAWKIVPLSWTARMPDTYLGLMFGDTTKIPMLKSHAPIYLIFTAICFAAYFIFAVNYEGSRITE